MKVTDKESIPNQRACKCRKGISSKKDIKAKRFRTQGKNKVTKKWIDELINEAVTDYEQDDYEQDDYQENDFDIHELFHGF